jgi:hypothetical protein
MRRYSLVAVAGAAALGAAFAFAPAAWAAVDKHTFNDVVLPDGQAGEIEATVKTHRNKDDSVACSYFTDDYVEHLGYSFTFVDTAPGDADAVLEFCLVTFDDRHS